MSEKIKINLSLRCCVLNSHKGSSHWFYVLKAVAIQTSEQLNLSMIFVVSHYLIATCKVSPEWRLNPDFWTQKNCPRYPFLIYVTKTKIENEEMIVAVNAIYAIA